MKTKIKKPVSKYKILFTAGVILLAFATVINSVLITYLLKRDTNQDNDRIANLILQGEHQVIKPAVIKPETGNIYLPDARLVLPAASETIGNVYYDYNRAHDDSNDEVTVASGTAIRSAETALLNHSSDLKELFNAVPRLQACSRGVRIGFQPEANSIPAATKKLSNGKVAYYYNGGSCDTPALLDYLQLIDSY